ncbi:ribonucleotide reductase stimulatory protein [Rossellomorea marisflavi]|uniref:ribonucleotide reductase stimulatory protein n=1 Tax=Rossellomorea marisflavi TaxID=189381 RepID=UPI003F9F751E
MGEKKDKSNILIAYDSRTGNVEWLARQLGYPMKPVQEFNGEEVQEHIFLMTHTFGKGSITKATETFLNRYAGNTIGVCVSGDRRWGNLFGLAGDKIRLAYDIPLVRKIDVRGYPSDIEAVTGWLQQWKDNAE